MIFRRKLTTREKKILQLLANGRTSKEAAVDLGVDCRTIASTMCTIRWKLLAETTTKAVLVAYVEGQIEFAERKAK